MRHSKGKQFNIVQQHPGSSCMCYPQISVHKWSWEGQSCPSSPCDGNRTPGLKTWNWELNWWSNARKRIARQIAYNEGCRAIKSTEILWKTRSRGSSTSCIGGHLSSRKQSWAKKGIFYTVLTKLTCEKKTFWSWGLSISDFAQTGQPPGTFLILLSTMKQKPVFSWSLVGPSESHHRPCRLVANPKWLQVTLAKEKALLSCLDYRAIASFLVLGGRIINWTYLKYPLLPKAWNSAAKNQQHPHPL